MTATHTDACGRLCAELLMAMAVVAGTVACGSDDAPVFTGAASSGPGSGGAGAGASVGIGANGSGASGGEAAGGGSASGGAGLGGSGQGGAGGGASSGCAGVGFAPGDHDQTIVFDGETRSYLLHVPTGYDHAKQTPLVVNFHGYTMDPPGQAAFSGMTPVADDKAFVLAYPAGIGNSWNGGLCCGQAASGMLDDTGFARAVVADIETKLCIDEKRVYSTGMSNGGYLTHRNGCESADLFAAIAPVAGVLGIDPEDCLPSRPIPVMHFHGTNDLLVPYGGGGLLGTPSVPDTDAGWAERNGCTGDAVSTYMMGDAHCETHETCDDGVKVTLCTIEGEGHCWPGQSVCTFGTSTTDISANEAMWEFFSQFSLP
jgi:polyhydroxybutyrate depolymerase